LLSGESGAGKTRLVEQFGSWATEHGVEVRWTRFVNDAGSRPPPLEALLRLLPQAEASMLREQMSHQPLSQGHHDDETRWRTFSTVAECFQGSLPAGRCILVLDDLHFASRLELDVLSHMRSQLPARTLFLATAEGSPRSDGSGDFDQWLMAHRRQLYTVRLRPFSSAELPPYVPPA